MMRKGAFAIFDALGTRGIWKRHPPDDVLSKFEKLERTFRTFLVRELGGPGIATPANRAAIIKAKCAIKRAA